MSHLYVSEQGHKSRRKAVISASIKGMELIERFHQKRWNACQWRKRAGYDTGNAQDTKGVSF